MSQTAYHFSFDVSFNKTTQDVSEHLNFDVLEFRLTESLSAPFLLEVELISKDPEIDFGKLLDQPAVLTIWQGSNKGSGVLDALTSKTQVAINDNLGGALGKKASSLIQNKVGGSLGAKIGDKVSQALGGNLAENFSSLGGDITAKLLGSGLVPIRQVHGTISDFTQGNTGFRRTRYSAVIEPQLARTQLTSDWRIFQQKAVPAILEEVFKENRIGGFNLLEQNAHLQREYCVEADETDFNFIQRLLAEEGFVYAFTHSEDSHLMQITDVIQTLGAMRINLNGKKASEGSEESVDPVLYQPNPAGDKPQPALREFVYQERVRTARQTQRDYTFSNPRYSQEHSSIGKGMPSQSSSYERYDYPGRYKQDSAGSPFTQSKLLAHRNDAKIAIAIGDDARIRPGQAFELTGHPRSSHNSYWRPVTVTHIGRQHTSSEEESANAGVGTSYEQTAELIPANVDWKAPVPAKPMLHGPQIARVVGPQNEEIYCDEWGRVKVQFPWDREGENNEHSSCWIRVAQGWGVGAGDGQMSIPRIGQEVIINYLDGDIDQPIIIARTNDALNPPPYELPKHKTRSTWRSQTHKGKGFNEIRFEDEREVEEIYIHAQKDQNIHINNSESIFIGNDRTEHVEQNEKIFIGHNRQEQVVHDEAVEIGNDRKHHVLNNEFLTIDQNKIIEIGEDRLETVGNHRKDTIGSNHHVEIGENYEAKIGGSHLAEIGGNYESKVSGLYELEAGQEIISKTKVHNIGAEEEIILQSPGGKIIINAMGVTIEGALILKGTMSQMGMGSGDSISVSGSPLDNPAGIGNCSEKIS